MVMLFPETTAEQAVAACEASRIQMSAVNWAEIGAPGNVTASFGVSTFRANDDAASLLARADAAMYQQNGAEKIVFRWRRDDGKLYESTLC